MGFITTEKSLLLLLLKLLNYLVSFSQEKRLNGIRKRPADKLKNPTVKGKDKKIWKVQTLIDEILWRTQTKIVQIMPNNWYQKEFPQRDYFSTLNWSHWVYVYASCFSHKYTLLHDTSICWLERWDWCGWQKVSLCTTQVHSGSENPSCAILAANAENCL